ncbi:Acg family FMN-binding oxidoreductase [Marinobacterium sediminicola]|uniref:Nitroreductase family protein n=1 Tax=Marinobacterium sediminicola TaxID=518898 RepID=A0ABY1S1E1_9GAMM|nr:nitroreductase family protein [Marinobacterium sediminicola]ULG69829.1 nitroreductase family protein [Marinobacterium sediminicola]SMR75357.1 Nitroreductase family protein [Marinobacterium sediminicola]
MDKGRDADNLMSLIQHAVLAPSSHNSQPWRFRGLKHQLELHADLKRRLPVNDPDNRELHISCGCALMNLRVSAAHAGWGVSLELLPESAEPCLLARISLDAEPADSSLAVLFDAMLLRRTYRNRFKKEALEPLLEESLIRAAEVEHCQPVVIKDDLLRDALVELIREGDSLQWQNDAWRDELAQWLHAGRKGDGLAVPGLVAPLVRGVVRHFDMGKSVASQDSLLVEESPALILLSTEGDSPEYWLQAGQALQRLLLVAQRQGIQASYLNQPIQVAELRSRLKQQLGIAGFPQILLRLGYPEEVLPASSRRPVEEVIMG